MSDFQAPNQDPGAERRLLLTFALTFVIIFITQQFISRYYKPSAPAAQKQEQTSPPPAAPIVPSKVENTPPSPKSPAVALKQSKTEETNTIENDLYKIKFSNRGAVATSWVLKKYKDDSGKPLELVNAIAAPQFGYPLSFFTYDKALSKKLNQDAVYVHTEKDSGEERSITFEYADSDVEVTKKFIFGDSYEVHVETSVMQKGAYVTAYPSWPAGFGDETVTPSYAAARIDIDREDKV